MIIAADAACGHRNWDHHHWSLLIFADESKFSLYHYDGHAQEGQRVGERLLNYCIQEANGNVGPTIMVWGPFHASSNSELLVVNGTVNQQRYIGILRQNLLPWARANFQRKLVLVHDNATPHTARNTRNILAGKEVEVMQGLHGAIT